MPFDVDVHEIPARYDSSGNLDATFGTGGLVNTDIDPVDFTSQDRMNSLAIQADGRIVAAGFTLIRSSSSNSAVLDGSAGEADNRRCRCGAADS